jgi:transposase InsO family protein
MGGLAELDDKFVAWTGGEPDDTWTGLKVSTPDFNSPNQLRSTNDVKGYNHRKTGLSTKFKKTDLLMPFKKLVQAHMKDTGLDTVAHLPDMRKKMSHVITDHARFTLDSARTSSADQMKRYDKYDRSNNDAAKAFLLDSLDVELKTTITELIEDNDSFNVVWLTLMNEIQTQSIERIESIKRQIKDRKPQMYAGQDLMKMAVANRADALELTNAGQYEHNLSLDMLKNYLLGGGADNEDFRFPLRLLKIKLDEQLIQIGYMDKAAADAHMLTEKLHYKDINNGATKTYRKQKDLGQWPPAKNASDSKAPPAGYGAHLAQTQEWCGTQAEVLAMIQGHAAPAATQVWGGTQAEVLALIQNEQQNRTKTGVCHSCNKPGHWSRECPLKKKDNGTPNWKKVAPAAGAAASKLVGDKTFNWCAKCVRWTPTHDTLSHTGGAGKPAATTEANLGESGPGLQFNDPSVWMFDPNLTLGDFWNLIFPYLMMFQFCMLFSYSPVPTLVATGLLATPNFLMTLLSATFSTMWDHSVHSFWAPLFWVVGLLVTLWLGMQRPPDGTADDPDPEPRWKRRNRAQEIKRQRRKTRGWSPGSIKSHGFHKQYPLSLRSSGHFVTDPPKLESQLRNSYLYRFMGELQSYLWQITLLRWKNPRRSRQNRAHDTVTRRKGGHKFGPKPNQKKGKRDLGPKYQPVPAHGAHNMGNCNFTDRQAGAARKIQAHVNMARVKQWNASAPQGMEMPSPSCFKMVMQAPARFRNALRKESSFAIIWDSGASISISPNKDDFVGPMTSPGIGTKLKGIVTGLSIQGQGHVMWAVPDSSGQLRAIKVPAYYVPQARVRLLSTTSLLQSYPGEKIEIEAHQMTLSGEEGTQGRGSVIARVNPVNNLPTTTAYNYSDARAAPEALNALITTVSNDNLNLSEAQKELVRWHNKLGHIGYKRVQSLMRSGTLAHSEATRRLHTAACKLTELPKCAACQFGKQKRRPTPGKTSSIVRDRAGVLSQDHLSPGQRVSVDHFVCSTKGRLFSSRGKSNENDMYCGGCIFVDHSSNHVHVEFQAHLNTHETLTAKENYELMCRDLGVVAQSFLTDNGSAFSSKEFASELAKFEQIIRFAGTGAHHHNGRAERSIQTIMAIARTMMLHSAIHWPDVSDACLWPMAVQHAVFLHNHMPNEATGISPHDIFTRSRWEQRKFHDLHVWGCPVYVLEKAMHDGKKLPRWQPRSHRTMNMGLSANHASTVPLVLNLATGYINSQFNIVFDDWFATVAASAEDLPDFNSPAWADMFGDSTFHFNFDDDDDATEEVVKSNPDLPPALERSHHAVSRAMEHHRPSIPLPVPPPAESTVPVRRRDTASVVTDIIERPVASSLVRPPREHASSTSRESFSLSPRESSSTPTRETLVHWNLDGPSTPTRVRWDLPSSSAYRQQREETSETVLTPATQSPTTSTSLRRSSRSNLGQGINRLVNGKSDVINLGKGHSSQRINLSVDDRSVNLVADDRSSAEKDLLLDIVVQNKIARDARPETSVLKDHLRSLLRTSNELNYPQGIKDMYNRALEDLDHSDYLALDQPNVYSKDSRFNKGAPTKSWLDPKLWSHENPGVAPDKRSMAHAFLVSAQPGLSHIYADNGITQPYAFKASNSDPDTLSYDEAMADVDRDKWIEAAIQEILSLEKEDTWTEVDIEEALSKVLPSQWVFRRKRTPDGNIKAYKARSVCRGDLEQGTFDTFAPVVAWSTVRFFLILSLILDWHTCSIDFSSAFVQAKLDKKVWIHLPRGFQSTRPGKTCLRLNKSIYGLSVAPKLWYEHLFAALKKDGFVASKYDPCLLFKKEMMLVIYVDDVGIAAKYKKEVDSLVQRLEDQGFKLTREGTFSEFLGIKFEKNDEDNSINMTQKGLIRKIIATAGMKDCNPNWTPASTTPLGIDPDGEPMDEEWSYRSIVGMLLYLTTNTRPDCSFAVSQVGRFCHDPKKSHATAIKTIVRYLHRTSDKGMIVRPTGILNLENYVDASFANSYGVEPAEDPISVKSRTGIIVFLAGCPLIWKSQLQQSIALSTFQSEYQALSHSMRILIPLRGLLLETSAKLMLPAALTSTILCRTHEDNASALLLANSQHLNNRNKYLAVKLHHFWSHVKPGIIEVVKCDTKEMIADHLTKPLVREVFERLRKMMMGW